MKLLETERLLLRSWRTTDLDDFYEYAKSPFVGPNAGWEPHKSKDISLKILQSFIEKQEVWAIVLKENKKVIGSIGAHPDGKRKGVNSKMIGYVLSEDFWGMGLMSEAVRRVIRYLFDEEKLDVLSICHFPFNHRSRRVIEKCGFKYEGVLRNAFKIYDGTVYDEVCYSILQQEYKQED